MAEEKQIDLLEHLKKQGELYQAAYEDASSKNRKIPFDVKHDFASIEVSSKQLQAYATLFTKMSNKIYSELHEKLETYDSNKLGPDYNLGPDYENKVIRRCYYIKHGRYGISVGADGKEELRPLKEGDNLREDETLLELARSIDIYQAEDGKVTIYTHYGKKDSRKMYGEGYAEYPKIDPVEGSDGRDSCPIIGSSKVVKKTKALGLSFDQNEELKVSYCVKLVANSDDSEKDFKKMCLVNDDGHLDNVQQIHLAGRRADKNKVVAYAPQLGLESEDVFSFLSKKSLVADKIAIMQGIVRALKSLHERRLALQDVKLENFIIGEGRIQACDLDSIIYQGEGERGRVHPITLSYASPEKIQALKSHLENGSFDPFDAIKADMFSLGVMLYIIKYHNYRPYNLNFRQDSNNYNQWIDALKEFYLSSNKISSSNYLRNINSTLGYLRYSKDEVDKLIASLLDQDPANRLPIAEAAEVINEAARVRDRKDKRDDLLYKLFFGLVLTVIVPIVLWSQSFPDLIPSFIYMSSSLATAIVLSAIIPAIFLSVWVASKLRGEKGDGEVQSAEPIKMNFFDEIPKWCIWEKSPYYEDLSEVDEKGQNLHQPGYA